MTTVNPDVMKFLGQASDLLSFMRAWSASMTEAETRDVSKTTVILESEMRSFRYQNDPEYKARTDDLLNRMKAHSEKVKARQK